MAKRFGARLKALILGTPPHADLQEEGYLPDQAVPRSLRRSSPVQICSQSTQSNVPDAVQTRSRNHKSSSLKTVSSSNHDNPHQDYDTTPEVIATPLGNFTGSEAMTPPQPGQVSSVKVVAGPPGGPMGTKCMTRPQIGETSSSPVRFDRSRSTIPITIHAPDAQQDAGTLLSSSEASLSSFGVPKFPDAPLLEARSDSTPQEIQFQMTITYNGEVTAPIRTAFRWYSDDGYRELQTKKDEVLQERKEDRTPSAVLPMWTLHGHR